MVLTECRFVQAVTWQVTCERKFRVKSELVEKLCQVPSYYKGKAKSLQEICDAGRAVTGQMAAGECNRSLAHKCAPTMFHCGWVLT